MTELRALPYDWKDVRRRLQARLPDLLTKLGIREPIRGDLVTPLNTWRRGSRPDRHPGSFVIWTAGEAAGAWRDYACPPDVAGDVFDLIIYTQALAGKMDAYWWALDFLGLGRGEVRSASQASLERQRAAQDRAELDAARLTDEAGKSAELFKAWLALPPIAGTIAERYLTQARGIPMQRLAHPPGSLRFSPALDHVDEDGVVTTWPAMVSAMTRGKVVVALHRTWLAPDGSGKAAVDKAKKMIGPVRGAAIRLSSGPSNLSPTKAAAAGKTGPLAIGEGIETCLPVAVARPDYRVWAAGSLSLMALIDWPDCASAVVLLRDNDWKPQARAAFDVAAARWRAQAHGRPVEIAASAVGGDFNDWARRSA